MITTPGSYAAWRSWCDAFARGEDLPTVHLEPIGDDQGPYMQERLLRHLVTAFHARQSLWVDQFQRDARHARTGGVQEFSQMLVLARSRLGPLAQLCRSPLLGHPVRLELGRTLAATVTSLQEALEREIIKNPGANSRLLGAVRQHSLVHGLTTEALNRQDRAPAGSAPPGRRVII